MRMRGSIAAAAFAAFMTGALPVFAQEFSGFSAEVPAGWQVAEKDGSVTMEAPGGEARIIITMGPVSGRDGVMTIERMAEKMGASEMELEDARTGYFMRSLEDGTQEECDFLYLGSRYALIRFTDRTKDGRHADAIGDTVGSVKFAEADEPGMESEKQASNGQ